MSQQGSRKPFVAPSLEEQASLVGVTLISGGHGSTKSKNKSKGKNDTKGKSSSHRHS